MKMVFRNQIIKTVILIVILSTSLFSQKKEIVAYFTEWSHKSNQYIVKNIVESGSAEIITVINYSFAEPGPDSSGKIIPKFMNRNDAYGKHYEAENSVDGVADSLRRCGGLCRVGSTAPEPLKDDLAARLAEIQAQQGQRRDDFERALKDMQTVASLASTVL